MGLLILCATYAVLNSAGLLLMRASLRGHAAGSSLPAMLERPGLLVGVAFYGLAFLLWVITLKRYPVTTVYPLFIGVGYVTVIAASFAFLDEPMSFWKLTGIGLVGAGVVFVVAS